MTSSARATPEMPAICLGDGRRLADLGLDQDVGLDHHDTSTGCCRGGCPERAGCRTGGAPGRGRRYRARARPVPQEVNMSGPDPPGRWPSVGEDELLAADLPASSPGRPAACSVGPATTPRWSPRPGGSWSPRPTRMVRRPGLARRVVHRRGRRRQGAWRRTSPTSRRWARVPTGLLVTLVAEPATPVAWVVDFARGLGEAARRGRGARSSAATCPRRRRAILVVSVTALGDLDGPRAGAALAGPGSATSSRSPARSGGRRPGWLLLADAARPRRATPLPGGDYHRRPTPDLGRRAGRPRRPAPRR